MGISRKAYLFIIKTTDLSQGRWRCVPDVWEENDVVIVTNVYGDFCVRKARRKRQKLLVRDLFYDYANKTTLHGLPYITRKGVSMSEKIFWLITFIASAATCLYWISKVWFKWQNSPVIVTVSEQLLPVGMVPFPSVTVCPQSKCKSSIYNYTAEEMKLESFFSDINSTLNSTLKEQFAKYSDISQVCGVFGSYYNLKDVFPNKYTNASVLEHISEVALEKDDIFSFCTVRGVAVDCEELFNEVVTSEGICYNINSLAANEIFRTENLQQEYQYLYANKSMQGWSMEDGYSTRTDLYPNSSYYYPAPGAENGAFPDLEIILQDLVHERDLLCNGLNTGFKVYVQHPADLPQSSLYYYAVLNGQVSSMALSFSALSTSESLRVYDPEIRQCYFPEERYLRYFSIYTASNCRMECLSNITFESCGCVVFYMPHNDSETICSTENELCVLNALSIDNLQRQESGLKTAKCHCLPSCNAVDYDAEILKTEYNLKQYLKVFGKVNNYDPDVKGRNYSKLEIYFKRPRFVSMRRSELFGGTEFLANCGGLLGLFLGFSFLSLVEIFYFLTLRLWCTLKKDLEEEKSHTINEKEVQIEKY